MSHDPLGDDIEDADSVTVAVCHCPHIHLVLYDASGEPFARAMFTPEHFASVVQDIENMLGHKLPIVDAIGSTVGHG